MSFTNEQLLQIAIAYDLSNSELSKAEYLNKIEADYKEFVNIYKSLHKLNARVGSKSKLGL